jgi:hypothetical protein
VSFGRDASKAVIERHFWVFLKVEWNSCLIKMYDKTESGVI